MGRLLRGEDVLNVTFTQTQFREGYDEREVDDFLDRATAALRHHEKGLPAAAAPMSSRDVSSARFSETKLRRGYDQEQIDAFLDDVVGTLEQYESGGAGPDARVPSTSGDSADRPLSAGPRVHEVKGGFLIEEESWGSRLLRKLRGDKG